MKKVQCSTDEHHVCSHWKVEVDDQTCYKCREGNVLAKRMLMEKSMGVNKDRNIEACKYFREIIQKAKACCGKEVETSVKVVMCKRDGHSGSHFECYRCSNYQENDNDGTQ